MRTRDGVIGALLGAFTAITILLLLAVAADARQTFRGPNEYVATVSATQTNTAVSFGFDAVDVLIVNDDEANEIYITLASTTATTSKLKVAAGESFSVRLNSPTEGIGIICASGETASVRVGAWR